MKRVPFCKAKDLCTLEARATLNYTLHCSSVENSPARVVRMLNCLISSVESFLRTFFRAVSLLIVSLRSSGSSHCDARYDSPLFHFQYVSGEQPLLLESTVVALVPSTYDSVTFLVLDLPHVVVRFILSQQKCSAARRVELINIQFGGDE
eukprot:4152072-Ditylum_brightwellii.AAC.1